MKKSILLLAVSLGILTSCDPQKEDKAFDVTNISASDLLAKATFKQFAQQTDEDGNVIGYVEAADGNYIEYNIPGVNAISIFTKDDAGAETSLMNTVTGTFTHTGGGMFSLVPRRGSDNNQTVYFRYINQNGESVESSTSFSVFVPSDIAYELKLIASNDYGSKVWKWDPSVTGAVWGNMGYCGGAGAEVGISGNGQWWGVTNSGNDESAEDWGNSFNSQLQHAEGGVNHGDGDLNAYMVFTEAGKVISYDKDGGIIREGTFKIENFDESDPTAWKVGNLKTDAILWPYEINAGGKVVNDYEIVYLTPDKMTLVYPDGGDFAGLGNWGEATFWHFSSSSDFIGLAAGYKEGKTWTWDNSITGAVWGNMGYCGGAGSEVGLTGNGQWWGVTSTEEFDGQLQHTHNGKNNGDGDLDAYMVFGTDGKLTSYKADGSVISSDVYEFKAVGNEWKVADLNTKAILWPYEINSGGNIPGTYEVVYLTNDKMTLVYPAGGAFGGLGSWGEATFWHFKAK